MTRAVAGADIEARNVNWQFVPGEAASANMTLPYAVIGGQPDRLLLTGLGETDVMGIAERLSERGITGLAVASLTYPSIPGRLSSAAVEQSIIKGTEALVHDMTGNGRGIKQGIGSSEGGSQLIAAARKNPNLFGQVVAIAPNGLNNRALGDTPKKQARTLLQRFGEAGLASGGGEDQPNVIELMKEIMGGLAYAESQDASEVIMALGDKLKIYIGDSDPIIPPAEAETGIGPDAITRVPGMGHPTLLDEAGCDQVVSIMQAEYTAGIVR